MDVKETLTLERTKLAKKAIDKAFVSYLSNRKKALKRINEKEMKEKLREIKEYSISNLDLLKRKTIENLREQNVKVYEAKDASHARQIALRLIPKKERVVKSKSNTISEIGLSEVLEKRNKITETDCGDFIVQICKEESSHPVTPALHIPIDVIVDKIKKEYKVKLKKDPAEISHWVRKQIKKEILNANIGLAGANVISSDGAIFILENEGNISLITRLPEKNIIIAGIDKIVPTLQDAMFICQAAAIWGTGSHLPAYINVISSPSKTADIEKKIVYGMHGAKEVHLILIDNGRTEIIKNDLKELLYCINCGSCLYFCPIYRQVFDKYGLHYFGGRGIGMTLFQNKIRTAIERGLYFCTTCKACQEHCPLDINIPEVIKKLRKIAIEKNFETKVNEKMVNNVRAIGNPFGEVKEGKTPDKLFCC